MEQQQKSDTSILSGPVLLSDSDILPSYYPLFNRRPNISKFNLILASEMLQFWNEATYLKSETWIGSAYDNPNFTLNLTRSVSSSEN